VLPRFENYDSTDGDSARPHTNASASEKVSHLVNSYGRIEGRKKQETVETPKMMQVHDWRNPEQ
jgi:hypothetical protein